MVEAVSITLLATGKDQEVPLVAAGCVDTRIHLFTVGADGKVDMNALYTITSHRSSPMYIYQATRIGLEALPSLCLQLRPV